MNHPYLIIACVFLSIGFACSGLCGQQKNNGEDQLWCVYEPAQGKANGKHIVLIAGDDEYRSEEALPMLGKILARRHGFKCTVLFPINSENLIQPSFQTNIPGMHHLDQADLAIMGLRFRNLPDHQMKHFADYLGSGKPIIGLRTSTHAFNYPKDSQSKYKHFGYNDSTWEGGFGQQVLGDTWISHHGHHKRESTRGVVVEKNASHPVLKGVKDIWGPTDVYGIKHLPKTATVLLDGAVLEGMSPSDKRLDGPKNNPMMPLAWLREYTNDSGKTNLIFCTTMGSSTDFESEDLRRLIVNAVHWCVGMEDQITDNANVTLVDPYSPTPYGFGNFKKGTRPSDYNLKNKTTQ